VPFDHDRDMAIERIDTKRLFQMARGNDGIAKKFSKGHFESSFL